ncbi:glycerol-3-phosphate acyltransferase [Pontiella agarivorans]|uniref:Glycerol-3-phosphate acyltransferase n=1 Tax=Pontiella agarivorans TaxID=3038953 RepID=A0ABU5MV87_9BACT|nr:glycerol-3-phosphate acyltransferase [Pontiella agarivorans]MDZ8118052.1 glycerol-3-phosphate acyltransferase [Pontiella agarivorans]
MTGRGAICILIAYLLGGICSGYCPVSLKTRTDICEVGSGRVGARNVGRILGRPGFSAALAADALKGFVAVLLAQNSELPEAVVFLVLVSVVAGHVWPVFIQFRGGRGIAPAIGAYLAFDVIIALLPLGLALLLMLFRQSFILSGLAAFLILPSVAYALVMPAHCVAALTTVAAIILFTHRDRIRKEFAAAQPRKEA